MIKEIITAHLISLQTNFNVRFEDFPEEILGWIKNPFHVYINEIKLGNLKISEELIDLSSDENLRVRFRENRCGTFWISIKSEYPELSKQAISILLPFATNYLCETTFSTLTIIKNKYRFRLNVEADLKVVVSNIKPNIELIMSTMQAQVSH
ncbi:protein FAM200A-like [Sipha flava]|uniref:Protein FAM200A-like n=1 Tax=Sipha flava TaxID=143950 RepID=A0A8B8GDP0_9HEMI|nr:protein FAM200A-like [Sipha flava]